MEQGAIARINELAKKAKGCGLTDEEKAERDILRAEYIAAFRNNLSAELDNVVVVDENGNRTRLKKKED